MAFLSPETTLLLIMTCSTQEAGVSYMGSSNRFSYRHGYTISVHHLLMTSLLTMIRRNPLAPVFFSSAISAIFRNAVLLNRRFTLLSANRPWYCFSSEFFGSTSTRTRSSIVRFSTDAITGNRPTNSGIRPYLTRSMCGCHYAGSSAVHCVYLPAGSVKLKGCISCFFPPGWLGATSIVSSSSALIMALNPIDYPFIVSVYTCLCAFLYIRPCSFYLESSCLIPQKRRSG